MCSSVLKDKQSPSHQKRGFLSSSVDVYILHMYIFIYIYRSICTMHSRILDCT